MSITNKKRTILSHTELSALYALPDFDDRQRNTYLTLPSNALKLVMKRPAGAPQMHCALQFAYFKAKHRCFRIAWHQVPDQDLQFILTHYFRAHHLHKKKLSPISKHEYYTQRQQIIYFFGYQPFTHTKHHRLFQACTTRLAQKDINPSFILTELLNAFEKQKIVRPGHTTLEQLISEALTQEQQRLESIIDKHMSSETAHSLSQLLTRAHLLSELAVLQQDAKNFTYTALIKERKKQTRLKPLYQEAKTLMPLLAISNKNRRRYAQLAQYHTAYELRRFKPARSRLYLLCYVWLRYQQINDNLVDAFQLYVRRYYREARAQGKLNRLNQALIEQEERTRIGHVLHVFVDAQIDGTQPFNVVKEQVFSQLIPSKRLEQLAHQFIQQPVSETECRWACIEAMHARVQKNIRPLLLAIDLDAQPQHQKGLCRVETLKSLLNQPRFARRTLSLDTCFSGLVNDPPSQLTQSWGCTVNLKRYEFWLYRRIEQHIAAGDFFIKDGFKYRCFDDELISMPRTQALLEQGTLPALNQLTASSLDARTQQLHHRLIEFNRRLKNNEYAHLDYNRHTKTLHWREAHKTQDEARANAPFYRQLPLHGIVDILHFVNEQCAFTSAFEPLQPHYTKQAAKHDQLFAVLVAQAMNHGVWKMATISDIPYARLEQTYQQYFRIATLTAANDRIIHALSRLPIFPTYHIDSCLYGSVDGQKYLVKNDIAKARHSSKYFGTGKGVVAYTLLANHVPLHTELMGA